MLLLEVLVQIGFSRAAVGVAEVAVKICLLLMPVLLVTQKVFLGGEPFLVIGTVGIWTFVWAHVLFNMLPAVC